MSKNIYVISLLLISLLSCKSTSENVLFSSSRNGNSDIYLMNAKGEGIRQITSETSEEWSPVWMNKNEISYLRQQGDEIVIVKNNLKTGKEVLLEQPENCMLDDKNILYARSSEKYLYGCQGEVYLFDPETQITENLTIEIAGTANYIAWGHQEQEVIFTSNHEGNNEVYAYSLMTKNIRNLTNNKANDERGEVSPDGKSLVFSSDRFAKGNQEIVTQDLQTGEIVRITKTQGTELIARWSANGEKIYFGSNKDGNWELYRYELQTKKTIRLTDNEDFDGDPRIN